MYLCNLNGKGNEKDFYHTFNYFFISVKHKLVCSESSGIFSVEGLQKFDKINILIVD